MRFHLSLVLLAAIIATSCSRENKVLDFTISVKIDESSVIDCNDFPSISFSDDFILSTIDDIQLNHQIFVIKSGNNLYGIDSRNGHFITKFSIVGNGPKEYIQLWDFCIDDGNVLLYDIDKKHILRYSKEGMFISDTPLVGDASANPFQYIFPLDDSLYVGKRIYGMPEVPELSVYDSDFSFKRQIGELKLKSGIRLWRQFYSGSDNDVLYAGYFSNNILSVRKDSVSCKYTIDFGKYSFDGDSYGDEYECIEQLNRHEHKYASLISNLYEDDCTFAFQFIKQGEKYLTVFDKKKQSAKTFKFTSAEKQIEQVLFVGGDKAFVLFSDVEDVERNGGYYVIRIDGERKNE